MVRKSTPKPPVRTDPLKRATSKGPADDERSLVHRMKGFRCDTEDKGRDTPHGRTPTELVLDATEGFVPLWARDTVLRWRHRQRSFDDFADPAAAMALVEGLFAEGIMAWGDAAPIRFSKRDDAWDFELVMRPVDDCNAFGCVLASAFFPDAGRHELNVYPQMFSQTQEEQVETMAHEVGHIFGLRHFFALVSEKTWPAEVFGTHDKFSIMNYGVDSEMSATDRLDLKHLYEQAWSGQLTHINETPIRFVKPFHESGAAAEGPLAIAAARTVIASNPSRDA